MSSKYMNQFFIILLVILSTAIQIQAQSSPGLLGKRFTVSYDYGFYFNTGLSSTFAISNSEESTGFFQTISALTIPKHYFGAEYTLTKRLAVGVNYNFYRRNLNSTSLGSSNNAPNFIQSIRASEYSVHLKLFKKASIAPIGYYNQLRVFAFSYTSELNGREDYFEEEPPVYVFDQDTKFGLMYGFGKQGIIFKNVLYNFGCELGFVAIPIFADD